MVLERDFGRFFGGIGRVAGHLIGIWGRGHSAAAGALARYREGARIREGVREARLAEANRQAGTGSPLRPPPAAPRPVRPQPPRPAESQDVGMPIASSQESEKIPGGTM